jgi:hypothetical protein
VSKDARALLSEIEDSAHRMHPTTLSATLVWLRRTTSALPSPAAARGRLPPYAHSPPPDDRYAPNRDTSIPPWARSLLAEIEFCRFMVKALGKDDPILRRGDGLAAVFNASLAARWMQSWRRIHPRSPGFPGL